MSVENNGGATLELEKQNPVIFGAGPFWVERDGNREIWYKGDEEYENPQLDDIINLMQTEGKKRSKKRWTVL